jgi:DNA replication and repair protein RecF
VRTTLPFQPERARDRARSGFFYGLFRGLVPQATCAILVFLAIARCHHPEVDPLLKSLHVLDLRNYAEAHLEFSEGVHALIGSNAQGKTNLLEALSLCLTGESFRSHHLHELIREGSPRGWAQLTLTQASIEQVVRVMVDPQTKKAWLNGSALPGLSHLLGLQPIVVLTPQDVDLVRGEPQARRQLLDQQLAQSDPLYHHHLVRYRRALKQRNALLKSRQLTSCEAWEIEMARSGAYLIQQRMRAVQDLQGHAAQILRHLAGREERLQLDYRCSANLDNPEQSLRQHWERLRAREIEVGQTLAGPHREDMILLLEGREAKAFASEGQARSLAAALRFAQRALLEQQTQMTPVLCIDDVGLSLDPQRCRNLFELIGSMGQVLCTAPSLEHLGPIPLASVFQVEAGQVQRQDPCCQGSSS